MFQTKVADKVKAHILYSMAFFFENRAFYEITWTNMVQPERSQVIIRRMSIAFCITKATDTHSEYVIILISFPLQQWLQDCATIVRYTCILLNKWCTLIKKCMEWITVKSILVFTCTTMCLGG